jgi:hypothetical protein
MANWATPPSELTDLQIVHIAALCTHEIIMGSMVNGEITEPAWSEQRTIGY